MGMKVSLQKHLFPVQESVMNESQDPPKLDSQQINLEKKEKKSFLSIFPQKGYSLLCYFSFLLKEHPKCIFIMKKSKQFFKRIFFLRFFLDSEKLSNFPSNREKKNISKFLNFKRFQNIYIISFYFFLLYFILEKMNFFIYIEFSIDFLLFSLLNSTRFL